MPARSIFPAARPTSWTLPRRGCSICAGSVARELLEETGLDAGRLEAQPGWTLVHDRGYLAMMKRLTAAENAERLRSRILRYLAGEPQPEFSDIRIVRGRDDLDPAMPPFLIAYFEQFWR